MQDVELLAEAVLEAGRLAITLFRQNVRRWRKDDNSPVSDADIAVDKLLRDRLMRARPSYGYLSEESEDGPARLSSSHVWVIDPIDGTRSYLSGGDLWCISAALVREGAPVAGIVYRPTSEHFYRASPGEGATCNHVQISTSAHSALEGARILGARQIAHRLPGALTQGAADLPLALRLCRVAEGAHDAFVALTPKNDWDICAGDLIVRESGGRVTDLSGSLCRYNRPETFQRGIIASCGALHGALLEAVGTDGESKSKT